MFKKILRTVIGLPLVLVAWPFAMLFSTLGICFWAIIWVFTGKFESCDGYTDEDVEVFTLPYQFIKSVWK